MTFMHIRPGDVRKRSKYETPEIKALYEILEQRPFRFCMLETTSKDAWVLWADSTKTHAMAWNNELWGWHPLLDLEDLTSVAA